MILSRYLSRHFSAYFISITVSLTVFYSVIELTEKIIHARHAGIGAIFFFIMLNTLPTFFDLAPLGTWIASCLFIYQLYQKSEWTTLSLTGDGIQKSLSIMTKVGALLCVLSFTGREIFIQPLTAFNEHYKMEHFKTKSSKKLFNQWSTPQENVFVYYQMLDLGVGTGTNITIFYLNDTFEPVQHIHAPTFSIDASSHRVTLHHALHMPLENNTMTTHERYDVFLPGLFLSLALKREIPSLVTQVKSLVLAKNLSSYYPFNQELGKLLSRFLFHLQPLLLILLTLHLFLLFPPYSKIRWVLMCIPYPFFVIANAFSEFLLSHNAPALCVAIPYGAAGAFITMLSARRRLLKKLGKTV